MAIEHLMSTSPCGVIELSREWFDAEPEADVACEVAQAAAEQYSVGDLSHPTISSAIVWIKSRLHERRVFWQKTEQAVLFDIELWLRQEDERRAEIMASASELPPMELGWARSQYVSCQLLIQPINGTAAKVIEFADSSHCPYCRKYFRNRAAQKLHVIDHHLAEI